MSALSRPFGLRAGCVPGCAVAGAVASSPNCPGCWVLWESTANIAMAAATTSRATSTVKPLFAGTLILNRKPASPSLSASPRVVSTFDARVFAGSMAISGAGRAGATGATAFPSRMALASSSVARSPGSRRKHARAIALKGSGKESGTTGSRFACASNAGGRCVRTSTTVTPNDQRSAAGEMLPAAVSGGA